MLATETAAPYVVQCGSDTLWHISVRSQLAGAVEYTDCISAEEYDSLNECSRHDAKQSDGEAPVLL